jgi:hypothetical protein
MAFVPPHFAHQKDGIENQTGNENQEEGNANDQGDQTAPIDNDPCDVESDSESNQAHSESDEKEHRAPPPGNAHAFPLGLSIPGETTYTCESLGVVLGSTPNPHPIRDGSMPPENMLRAVWWLAVVVAAADQRRAAAGVWRKGSRESGPDSITEGDATRFVTEICDGFGSNV